MFSARHLLAPIALVAAVSANAAAPRPIQAFDQAAFDTAQKQGRPIIVFVHAPWCPVCRSQIKTLDKVTQDSKYRNLAIFRIDYDTQKPLWQKFGATQQSTLIAYHGKRETARIAHDTDEAKVTQVIAATLS